MATSVKIDEDLKQRIQQLADSRHRSAHWIMREAIRHYVEHEEKRQTLFERFANSVVYRKATSMSGSSLPKAAQKGTRKIKLA